MRLLVFNAGSSSLKFDMLELAGSTDGPALRRVAGAFIDAADGAALLRGLAP
jgi:acetate kinase